MQLGAITAQRLVAALGADARLLAADPGSELAAGVVEGPNAAGHGMIALAGMRLAARLPAGVQAGDVLRLTVVRATESELVARIAADAGAAPRVADAAGRLALTGDGDAMRAALALAGGAPLWLPDGRAAEVAVDADDDAANDGTGGTARASFVLHCPHAGAIEVHLAIDGGGIRAGVVTPPGATAERAEAATADLVAALSQAAGRPASAEVRARPPAEPAPRPPAGRIDEHA
jgi:hypothetical protein